MWERPQGDLWWTGQITIGTGDEKREESFEEKMIRMMTRMGQEVGLMTTRVQHIEQWILHN